MTLKQSTLTTDIEDPRKTSFFASRWFYVLLLGVVLCSSAVLSHVWGADLGLVGWGLGVGLGAVVGMIQYPFLRRVKTAEGHAVVAALMASVIASFFVLILGVFLIQVFWREVMMPASLTAVALYLTHRFTDALQAWPRAGLTGRPREESRETDEGT